MQENKTLQAVYTFFLGLLLAIFVGVGINTFYPAPKMPEYPSTLNTYGKEMTAEQEAKQREWDATYKDYNEDQKPYNRNVALISLSAAVVLLLISILQEKRIKFIADGVMLGGLFTLIYGISRSFASEDSRSIFAMVSAGLFVVLYLGYHRFVRPQAAPAAKSKVNKTTTKK